jgi:PhzF family phenazine biosynthesis protein
MHVHTLRCFGANPGDGNPALVIEGDGMELPARQAYTAARNTTCVFLGPAGDGGAIEVDYFYPHTRSPLCLHATLAVAAVLFGRGDGAGAGGTIAVRTAMKGQVLELSREGDAYFVRLAPQPAPQLDIGGEQAAALLGAPGLALASPPRLASVGSPKLLVQVNDVETLSALAPDLAGIVAWGKEHGVSGIYAYCRLADGVFEGRNFNHLDPALEDSATGVAAGALAVALGRDLVLRQGRVMANDCLIRARVEGDAILVGGTACSLDPMLPNKLPLFRQANSKDIPAMSRIRLDVTENVLSDPRRVTQEMYEDFLERSGRGWVAENKGEIVAFCYADKDQASIWALFVCPGHEGQGLGKALLKLAVDWLFDIGHDRVHLTTGANTRADRFYAAQGWLRVPLSASEIAYSMTQCSSACGTKPIPADSAS